MKVTLSSVKKRAWGLFSKYIRLRDCYETTKSPWSFICCTCGKETEYSDGQASHFLASRCNSILFEETCCHAACVQCNIYKHGNIEEYYPFMLKKYGQKEIDRLKRLKGETRKFTIEELEELCKTLKEKTNTLLNN
jgi:hypothetical protein